MKLDTLTLEEMVGTIEEFEREFADLEEDQDDPEEDQEILYHATMERHGRMMADYYTYDQDEIKAIVKYWEFNSDLPVDEYTIKMYNNDTLTQKIIFEIKEG